MHSLDNLVSVIVDLNHTFTQRSVVNDLSIEHVVGTVVVYPKDEPE
jgi:hypothetical protein